MGSGIAALVQSYSVRDFVITVTALPIVLSAPLFYSLEAAPAYLRAIAAVNPLTYQVAWIRSDPGAVLAAVAGASVWAIVGMLFGLVLLTRTDRLTRER